MDGRRIPWEVWGRRSPALYFERRGGNVVFSDGAQRLVIYEAGDRARRPAFALRTAPGHRERDVDWSAPWTAGNGPSGWKPFGETARHASFKGGVPWMEAGDTEPEATWTISKETLLPAVMEIRRHPNSSRPYVLGERLTAEYNKPLPGTISVPTVPRGVRLYDALSTHPDANLPTANVATSDGLTTQVVPVAMDRRGVLLVRIKTWLGATPIDHSPVSSLRRTARRPAAPRPSCSRAM